MSVTDVIIMIMFNEYFVKKKFCIKLVTDFERLQCNFDVCQTKYIRDSGIFITDILSLCQ